MAFKGKMYKLINTEDKLLKIEPPNTFIQSMPYPPKTLGDFMKKGLVIIGIILLVVGLLLMLLLWPMIGTIDADEAAEKMLKAEEGTYTVVEELDEDEWKGIEELKKDEAALKAAEALIGVEGFYDNVDGPGTYTYTLEINGPMDYKMSKLQKVPTIGGILGLIILIVGVILLIVGFVTGKAAPAPPPEQPPMEQPPMQEPYQQPPPP